MSVMDSVDKYRHGVLIGNYVQDEFGKQLAEKVTIRQFQQPGADNKKISTTRDHHDIQHSLYQPHQMIYRKQPETTSFYQTSKTINQANYRKPETETTYHIFHRQYMTPHIPILENQPKKQKRFTSEGKLYDDTRYHLSNKFEKYGNFGASNTGSIYNASNAGAGFGAELTQQNKQPNRQSMRQTGNIYDMEGQQIPDILTGAIYKAGRTKPENQMQKVNKDPNEPTTKITSTVIPKSINPCGTSSAIKPQIAKFDEEMYRRYVFSNEMGEERDILFGHGIEINEFHRRQLATTYDLSYNQRIKPQTQVNSFYNVNPNESAKMFHRQTFFEKNHQGKIPQFETKTILSQQKLQRPYNPYTKTFDQKHMKDQYLRK